jgi:hypothetical protein
MGRGEGRRRKKRRRRKTSRKRGNDGGREQGKKKGKRERRQTGMELDTYHWLCSHEVVEQGSSLELEQRKL